MPKPVFIFALFTLAATLVSLRGLSLAWAEDTKTVMPPEVVGFRGTVTGTIAQAPGKDWFIIKVVKVSRYVQGNKVKLSPEALTAIWKDKHIAVLLVKTMPELKVGDLVTVTAFQFEMHLRSIDGVAVKETPPPDATSKPGDGAKPPSTKPN